MIGQQVILFAAGMAAGVAASLATGLAVRVALGARPQAPPVRAPEGDHEQQIAVALAAICGFGKSR